MPTFKPIVLTSGVHIKADGTTNIKIRLYHNKATLYIPTPHYINPQYLSKSGSVLESCPYHERLNYELGEIVQKCRGISIKLGHERISRMSCEEVKQQIVAALVPDGELIDFVEFASRVIAETEKEGTSEWYQNATNALCWFYGRKKIDIRDITGNRMNEFAEKLSTLGMGGKPLKPGAISNYLRAIRSLFNKAKKKYNNEDYDIIRIPNDPFLKVKIPKYRRSRKSLQINDIIRIRDGEFSTGRANMARDVFMMMFYMMGININDLYKLKEQTRGRIEYERSKTETEDNIYRFSLSIKVEPELQKLIDQYSDISFLSYFHRKYSNVDNFMRAVNKGLKQVSEELNLGFKITTNWARHSWASVARNNVGISKADIDFCLGHVNNDYKMADIYIDIDYLIFDKTNRKILDLLKKKTKNNLQK